MTSPPSPSAPPPGSSEPGALLGPADIRELAAALGVRPTKQLGQNFVIDANTVRRIVRTADVRADDVVVEVGPGLGSLTLGLLETADRVVAVEIDPVLAGALPHDRAGADAAAGGPLHPGAQRRHADRDAARPRAHRTGRQPPVQRRRPGAAAHAGHLPLGASARW